MIMSLPPSCYFQEKNDEKLVFNKCWPKYFLLFRENLLLLVHDGIGKTAESRESCNVV